MVSMQKTSVNCDRPKFTKCDRCILDLLSPCLMQAEENKPECRQIQLSQLTPNGDVSSPCLPLYIEQAGRQLIIRLIPNPIGEQYLLLLEEQEPASFCVATLELLGLTKREAEVLFWIAKDKSNAGIARVLGCCEGTVRKHLEHLYKKLGVQTRMGAVMIALERLGLLKG